MVKVKYGGKEYKVKSKTAVIDFIKDTLKIDDKPIMACKVFNEVKSLNYEFDRDCSLELVDTSTRDGNRIYVRGLTFILVKAFEELFPDKKLHMNYALGHALYCTSDKKIKSEDLDLITKKMKKIIKDDLPFEKRVLTLEEAMNIYKDAHREDRTLLLENRMKTHVSMYYCGDTFNYFYGVMPISTGYVKLFELTKYEDGLLLSYPRRFSADKLEKLTKTKKLYATFEEYDKIHRILGIDNLAGLNKAIKDGRSGEIVRICEALHEKKIAAIADAIASDRKRKIILIAGPSSSGKTTFAQRLGVQLQACGIKGITISMDNYFVDREKTPKDENGNYDFECLEALDLELFDKQIQQLINGETVKMPVFNFIEGRKEFKKETTIGDKDILIIEGIHALDPKILEDIPRENKYKIYISPLTELRMDDHNRIPTSDNRLLRRIIRDNRSRNYTVEDTLRQWASVRAGEEKYIFPYQDENDVMVNSSSIYEMGVLKTYVEPLLYSVGQDSEYYEEARRLLKELKLFLPIPSESIPEDAVLREFIGGSYFHE